MDLLERLKKFHEETGVSYKIVAKTIGVSIGVMYNFTSGIRELKTPAQEKLDGYLKNHDY